MRAAREGCPVLPPVRRHSSPLWGSHRAEAQAGDAPGGRRSYRTVQQIKGAHANVQSRSGTLFPCEPGRFPRLSGGAALPRFARIRRGTQTCTRKRLSMIFSANCSPVALSVARTTCEESGGKAVASALERNGSAAPPQRDAPAHPSPKGARLGEGPLAEDSLHGEVGELEGPHGGSSHWG